MKKNHVQNQFRRVAFKIMVFLGTVFFSCSGEKAPEDWKSYEQMADCYLDSVTVRDYIISLGENYHLSEPLFSFYRKRNYAPVWISSKGSNEYAGNLMNLLSNEEKIMKTRSDSLLRVLQVMHREVLQYEGNVCHKDSLALKFEILLTQNFFEYAQRNWGGADDAVLKKVHWFIKRKRLNYEQLLTDFLEAEDHRMIKEPVYPQYGRLKNYLEKYYEIELIGGWATLPRNKSLKLVKGDSSAIIPLVRQQLYVLGDLDENRRERLFDEELEKGIRKFQKRHGLKEDGVIGGKTLQTLNVPVQDRIRQILINMERCRWVPHEIRGDYIVVNIPEFRMHVFTNDKLDWSCNVIVGKSNSINNTVIFNDSIEHIVFNPYWNIPKNILMMETLPSIRKDRRYLSKNNLEVVDRQGNHVSTFLFNWGQYEDNFPYIIRERPGPNNSLGKVKFLFPNPYDIYLHDTPARSLFSESNRAFSHGCIRVEQPLRLAAHLLKDIPKWDSLKIQEVISTQKETYVKLKKKVPVFLTYFTAWVDKNGEINFREDVYEHDRRMSELLIVN